MPYIDELKRQVLDPSIDTLHELLVHMETDDPDNNMEGNLNYLLTRLFQMVYGDQNSTRYSSINDAMGVLECVKQEFYRKVAAPYENQKEHDNGEIVRFRRHDPYVTDDIVVKTKKRMEEDDGSHAIDDVS